VRRADAVTAQAAGNADDSRRGSALEVLGVATRLGLTSFGGPVAHLGYFREEYVRRRRWITEDAYADIVALCQLLPGPTSSQVGVAIGILRAGLPGAVAAWLGFTLPSAILLVAFAFGLQRLGVMDAGWLHGLKIAAVAVVANAVWGMARSLAPDRERATIAIVSAIVVLAWSGAPGQVLVIVLAGLIGSRLFSGASGEARVSLPPVMAMIFTLGDSRRNVAMHSSPSSSGIRMSVTTRSVGARRYWASASLPLLASATR